MWLSAAPTTMCPLDVLTSAASQLTMIWWRPDLTASLNSTPWCSAPVMVRHTSIIYLLDQSSHLMFLDQSSNLMFLYFRQWPPPLLLHRRGAGGVSGLVQGGASQWWGNNNLVTFYCKQNIIIQASEACAISHSDTILGCFHEGRHNLPGLPRGVKVRYCGYFNLLYKIRCSRYVIKLDKSNLL